MKPIEYKINVQGVPTVKGAYIVYESDTVVCIRVEMLSQWTKVLTKVAVGTKLFPAVLLYAEAGGTSGSDTPTTIYFPTYEGYEVFSYSEHSTYSINITLINYDKNL